MLISELVLRGKDKDMSKTKIASGEILEELLSTLTEEQLAEVTYRDLLDVNKDIVRKVVYSEFPSADPKVLESLLLLHENFFSGIATDFGISLDTKMMQAIAAKGVVVPEQMERLGRHFSAAMTKTIKQINS